MHQLPPLPFTPAALEPFISGTTIELHHDRHHRAYVNRLNELVSGTSWQDLPLAELLHAAHTYQPKGTSDDDVVEKILANAQQHFNHTFLWSCLIPDDTSPSPALSEAIQGNFGSLATLEERLIEEAASFGRPGWIWLVIDPSKQLNILATPTDDNPLLEGIHPLLALDMWEHAYYLDYQNRKAVYMENLLHVINWDYASRLFEVEHEG